MEQENQVIQALKEALAQDYAEYHAMLQGLSRQELIERSLEIASVREVYSLLHDNFDFLPAEVEHLLTMEKPLHFLADVWYLPTSWESDAKEKAHEILRDLESPGYLKQFSAQNKDSGQEAEKSSVRKQLHTIVREIGQQLSPKGKAKGGEAR